jgi:ribonucleoside-diphosphate reductase alpha chain
LSPSFTAPFEQDFAHNIFKQRYAFNEKEDWRNLSHRVVTHPMSALFSTPGARSGRVQTTEIIDSSDYLTELHVNRQFIAGGRYLYAAGRDLHQVNNCVLLNCPDTREGWASTSYQAEMSLMTGAGIGAYYGECRPGGHIIRRTGGVASGPLPKMQQVNETGRHTMQGGNRRSAIWAGLPWFHPDIFEFIKIKDWSDEVRALKEKDWTFPAPMDMTNISVCLDDAFFWFYEQGHLPNGHAFLREQAPEWMKDEHGNVPDRAPDGDVWAAWAHRVYKAAVSHMTKHGEPGFSVDTDEKWPEKLRNACTEITSADDSDVCNLGSLVLPRFESPQEFEEAVRHAVLFLTAGSEYSDVPYDKVREVREKNRRLGLGLIGVHEFLMKHGVKYGTDQAFEVMEPYMEAYGRALEFANEWQDRLGLSLSLGATAIAPNGTIGIVAESTPSSDPMFSAAELRQVKSAHHSGNDTYTQHVVVDPVAARLVAEGVDSSLIEDAHTLSLQPERRFAQQAFMQKYVDHAISSTTNLAHVMNDSEAQDFGRVLLDFLPDLRGMTVYPDGARAGQPRTPVDLDWALQRQGVTLETDDATCSGGVCGV